MTPVLQMFARFEEGDHEVIRRALNNSGPGVQTNSFKDMYIHGRIVQLIHFVAPPPCCLKRPSASPVALRRPFLAPAVSATGRLPVADVTWFPEVGSSDWAFGWST